MPPPIGWAAASGSVVNAKPWMLYICCFGNFPTSLAIAWMYLENCARAEYVASIVYLPLAFCLLMLGK